MKERPILFSGPMVRAILAGEKTQTRRIVKLNPYIKFAWYAAGLFGQQGSRLGIAPRKTFGQPGDRLWVKETHAFYALNFDHTGRWHPSDPDICCHFREGCPLEMVPRIARWRPSIFMPRWASRITLEITAVRAERLQDISEADAIDEGMSPWYGDIGAVSAREQFEGTWEFINGSGSWASNPWVWVITFRKITA